MAALALAVTFVTPFSFPCALRAFRAFGAFERNVGCMHRLSFAFDSALPFAA